jgi:hypothetical protein
MELWLADDAGGSIMKRQAVWVLLMSTALCFTGISTGHAEMRGDPFQLALVNPIQIRSEEAEISILRVNLIYGRNVSVVGLDIGLINHSTGGVSKGFQYGLGGYVQGDFIGWQDNAISIVEGDFLGFQSGFYNQINTGEAFQMGFVNRATDMSGLQLGLINYTEGMYGLQVGLVNVIRSKEKLPFFPIVNWSF